MQWIWSRKAGLIDRSMSLTGYQAPKHCAAFLPWDRIWQLWKVISNFYRLLQKLPAQEHFKFLVHVTSAYVIYQAYLLECFWLANGVQTFCNALCCAKPPQQYQNEISCNYILGTTSSFMLDWAEETPQIIQTAVGFLFFILLCLCQNCVSRFRCRKAGRSIT